MKRSKHRGRDDRDYDTSSLTEARGRRELSRDYSAHFFRWSFARRLISPSDRVLDVGCGVEAPLLKLLTVGVGGRRCRSYVGVDLNELPRTGVRDASLLGGFDFVRCWRTLAALEPKGFDAIACLEVVEHMRKPLGERLLAGCRGLLAKGGRLLLSTPAYDGVYHAANHVHEWKVDELERALGRAGLKVVERFATHMDLRRMRTTPPLPGLEGCVEPVADALRRYYDDDALSCILAPLHPAAGRNFLWVCS